SEALATALAQETGDQFAIEAVICDNDSPDDTRETVERLAASSPWPVKYVHVTRRGDAQARNGGLPHCEGDWIAFMDDDELARPDWLLQLYRTATRQKADLVGGGVELDMPAARVVELGLDVRRSLRERSEATCGPGLEPRPFSDREFPGTDNLLISRKVLETLGEFDEAVMSGTADYDFSIRARRAGFSCWYVPAAIVRHRTPANRLTDEFIGWESLRSGVMLAQYDRKYKGLAATTAWLAMRMAQGTLVSVPKWALAKATGNAAELADRRIRLLRLQGYAKSYLCEALPWLFSRQRLYDRLDFIKGRQIGKSQPVVGASSQGRTQEATQ
ncbi:MAG: glycosyltransferase family 2 protein, partial [Planctomycetales bacterium]|nr:glycosyltransferase family 2 protein [Planctomycetales bacterium]